MADKQSKINQLKSKAKACVATKVDIPMSPLWNMGQAAKYSSDNNFQELQDALHYLACKAQANTLGQNYKFTDDDKELLIELYEAFWWGGRYKGLPEAAKLADYYVNGDGSLLKINSEVYENSIVVKETMKAMKLYILELRKKKVFYMKLKCSNPGFMAKSYAKKLRYLNFRTEGKMKSNGVLEAAQNDQRLHKADGHFYLEATSIALPNKKIKTTWSVDSVYDFEPFEKQMYYSEIPLGKFDLVLYDGLSEYMVRLGIAKVFSYRAEWSEIWDVE